MSESERRGGWGTRPHISKADVIIAPTVVVNNTSTRKHDRIITNQAEQTPKNGIITAKPGRLDRLQ